jgi:hypothetical protein
MSNEYVGYSNIVPLLSPVDTAATALTTPFVSMANAHSLAFCFHFGSLTSTSADEYVTVTVEAATAAASGSEVTVPFTYRKSGAVGANTWGAATTATTAGVTMLTASEDDMMLWIQIDPAAMLAELTDALYVRAVATPLEGTATLVSAFAFIEPRYRQTTYVSAT